MKANLDCIPCFLKQTIEATRMATSDKTKHIKAVKQVMAYLQQVSLNLSPPEISKEVHHIIRSVTNNSDPYEVVKKQANNQAAKSYPHLQEIIKNSSDPLLTAITLAIIGNVIDFGTENRYSLEKTIETYLYTPLDKTSVALFKKQLKNAKEILYLADNTGEIYFDKLLLHQIKTKDNNITYVVKAHPIINDAMKYDAISAGIKDYAVIIEGDKESPISCPGMVLSNASNEFQMKLEKADMVISKGQGNYEALNDINRDVFFLLMIKCPLISSEINEALGKPVFKYKAKK
jgi:damage-control phosphatase, subfamily I